MVEMENLGSKKSLLTRGLIVGIPAGALDTVLEQTKQRNSITKEDVGPKSAVSWEKSREVYKFEIF